MEAMEVDLHLEGTSGEVEVVVDIREGQGEVHSPAVIIESGSSTELEDDDDDDDDDEETEPAPANVPLLPTAWAFSQRARVGALAAARTSASQGPVRLRRIRQGLRVHYPTQTSAPSSRFLDFHLRAPAANIAEPDSDSNTEVSESEDETAPPAPADIANPALHPGLNPPLDGGQQPNPTDSVAVPDASRPDADGEGNIEVASAPEAPAASVPGSSTPPTVPLQAEEGEGYTCPICFEAWMVAGDHRPATLRCGHIFGSSCIDRWLRGQGQAAKCPQCNKKAKRGDPIVLYARKLIAMDNAELESMKGSLEQEQSLRRKAELESAQCRLQLQVMTDECGKLKRQLQELKTLMSQQGSGSSQSSSASASLSTTVVGQSQRQDSSKTAIYNFLKAVVLSPTGGCRVLSFCEPLSCLLASQPSPHSNLVPGCGVKKVSAVNMRACQYVAVHTKQIRGLAFNKQADSLMLSAALDSTVKLTSLLTNTVVQTYNAGKPVWSCCWCMDNTNYIYAGLINGSVLIYDTRDTSTHVQVLQPPRFRCPVASLSYIPRAASSTFPCGGLMAGSLEGAYFWEQVDATTYRPHILPLETSGCTDIQVEPESRHCLVTYRPGRLNPSLRCVLMELNRTPQQESGQEPSCSCYPVQTFQAGSSCKLLTKNAVFKSPAGDGSTLVCAGDEATSSAMVWDAGTGALMQKLRADLPVVDICPFEVNGGHYLASLTEKLVKIYKWE